MQQLFERTDVFLKRTPFFLPLLQPLLLRATIWSGIAHGQLRPAALVMSPPHLLPTVSLLALGVWREPWCCASTAQQETKYWCDINKVLALYGLLWEK